MVCDGPPVSANTAHRRMWGLLTERLPTLYATATPQVAHVVENRNDLAPAQTAASKLLAQAGASDIHVQPRQRTWSYSRGNTFDSWIFYRWRREPGVYS